MAGHSETHVTEVAILTAEGLGDDFSPLVVTTRCVRCGIEISRRTYTPNNTASVDRDAIHDGRAAIAHAKVCTQRAKRSR
jgi:hypothetical protein